MLPFGKKRREADAAARRATRPVFEARGWKWEDATPPPALEIAEAAMRARRSQDIWPTGMSEVVTGEAHGHQATAARLVGYEHNTGSGGNSWGERREVNLVWMRLPAALPEIRFGDTTLGRGKDYGIRLPWIPPMSPNWPSSRWSVEGFIPAFAIDLLTPGFRSALEVAPTRCPIVIRAGFILTYGSETLDVATVDARLALLASLVEQVPSSCWGRADALVAGTGVFPQELADGSGLRLEQRLVARDWKGYGLNKVDWRDTPTAEGTVTLKLGEAHDVWENTPPADGTIGIRIGKMRLLGTPTDRGIPTVASTLDQP
ncbi:hypothetical protein [Microbacterium sp. CIAB417]|uniref:hypothetical protein n=1 Tax=Microbacterium sp. CIAB417 TaxID=2860287 RepID=UPI001FAD0318|nr:hypothetical protein [Microbacterium sp. CIAB417]